MPMDTRYRDMRLQAAPLGQGSFNATTGMLNGDNPMLDMASPDSSPDSSPFYDSPASLFGERFVGNINGAKPRRGPWMHMKDTSKISTSYYSDQNLAFAYFMNMEDAPFFLPNTPDAGRNSNYYRSGTFFIGSAQGCPDIIDWYTQPQNKRHTLYDRLKYRRLQGDNCYNYYILNHSLMPWYAMERPGPATEDPLSQFNPERSFLNNCQPLINGVDASFIEFADDPDDKPKEKLSGFSPVWQYVYREDMDEAEYRLSTYLQRSWNANFVYLSNNYGLFKLKNPAPFNSYYPPIGLPCVLQENSSPFWMVYPPEPPEPPPAKNPCLPDSVYDTAYYDTCSPPFLPIPPDLFYISPGKVKPYYCPNVEKITEPSHPFSPRNDYGGTDRDYSSLTSFKMRDPKDCNATEPKCWGYTDWNVPESEGGRKPKDKILNPVVQCAVVPVDIMNFRAAAFDTCIMQRINWNFNIFIQDWLDAYDALGGACPDPQHTDHGGRTAQSGWRGNMGSPCKTRYWEGDTTADCPVKMSIQQCCRIIVKDVVPANFVKLRTCEGKRPSIAADDDLQDLLHSPTIKCDYDSAGVYNGMGSASSMADTAIYSIVHTSNDPLGADFSIQAHCINVKINEKSCYYTEPSDYAFTSYFAPFYEPYKGKLVGYHMPYMRWWDTGVSANNPTHGGSFSNTLGGFDVLIGVGREERSQWDAKDSKQIADSIDGHVPPEVNIPQPAQQARVGGWSELKAHEMQTIRGSNLFCIGRYEKLFKPGATEAIALSKAGAGYTSKAGVQWPWSWPFLGYASDTHGMGFPGAFGTGSWTTVGLDNALPGDIVRYYINGMPYLGYITDIGGYAMEDSDTPIASQISAKFDFNIAKYRLGQGGPILHPTRVYMITWDNGKYQSATGSSINWGMGHERTIYKNRVPDYYRNEICGMTFRALTYYMDRDSGIESTECLNPADDNLDAGKCISKKCQPSCVDPDYNSCVLPGSIMDWNAVMVFRPNKNNFPPCNGGVSGAPNGYQFNLAQTYAWQPSTDDMTAAPDPSVIYQSQSGLVNTNLWSYCVNEGFPPPHHWARGYKGAQTGAITRTTHCGPEWHRKASQSLVNACNSCGGSTSTYCQNVCAAVEAAEASGCSASTHVYKFFPQSGGWLR